MHSFYDFRKNPLAVIDANGSYYDMVNTSDPPSGVNVDPPFWNLQGGRVLDLVAEFQPLARGVTEAKVLYKASNSAEPLPFAVKP